MISNNEHSKNYPEQLNDRIQQILASYSENKQLFYIEDFLKLSLKEIDNEDFGEEASFFISEKLIYYREKNEEEELESRKTREALKNAITCICQIAYLKSLQYIINCLDEETKNIWIEHFGHRYIYELFGKQLDRLEAWHFKLEELYENDRSSYINEINIVLFISYDSELAKALKKGLNSFILTSNDSSIITLFKQLDLANRVKRATHQSIIHILEQEGDITNYWMEIWLNYLNDLEDSRSVWKIIQEKCQYQDKDWKQLSPPVRIDKYLNIENNKYDSINEYLKEKIKGKFDKATVFNEKFTFNEIYVPLKIEENTDLKNWVIETIQKREKCDQVLCIEGETGSGKSVFFRMLSDWTLKHLYPLWIPILIKLEEVEKLGKSFQETLEFF